MTHRKQTRVRLVDIAAAAGVAPSTVSRALTNPMRVNHETLGRVTRVAARLGYVRRRKDKVARTSRGHHGVVGLVVLDSSNGVSSQMLKGAQMSALNSGYVVVQVESPGTPRQEKALIARLSKVTDGIGLP